MSKALSALVVCYIVGLWYFYNATNETVPYDDPINLFIGSAHPIDLNGNETHTVLLNCMADDNKKGKKRTEKLPLYCVSDQNEKVSPQFSFNDGNINCAWKNYFVKCLFKSAVNSVKLVDEFDHGPEVPLRKPVEGKIPLVTCLSRAFYFETWQLLLTSLEMYHAMGVSEFSMNVMSMDGNIYNVLQQYKKLVNIKVNPGIVIPKIVSF
ncbi:unnamed protein product [Bursaphelenchus okinawaensis]|uniref:Glycosyltransferase family 92 protein n=1 Tax=Bursaphelenchus okinawaensis TaxID=465554 RepID=A0A811KFP2_9BILA|nr:unnamed protein product [Bursaphelenchus okinawaensis]CAG9101293.1 unnamed protein product [Bursaphelenchus okinawaensis]